MDGYNGAPTVLILGEGRTYKTLNVSCRGSNASLRVTGSQIPLCTPPALYDKEKVW